MFDYPALVVTSLPLSLFGAGPVAVCPTAPTTRLELDECCWLDIARGFLHGADELLGELEAIMAWSQGRRLMYGEWRDEPRLTASELRPGVSSPGAIEHARTVLTERYGRAFEGLLCNYYRTGSDSVAWHADRIGRTELDPLVAILSLGGPRTFAVRPFGGGPSQRIGLHTGDLLVMGGATQHHWEHAVPKTRHAPPRMSITMRAGGPRRH
jgi:alkylated DNA repair dioxygenase AlkB